MSSSRWRMPLNPKVRLSSLALGIVPAIIVLGWLGIWLPPSLRLLMLSLFDQMGELIYYPLAAIALAGGFFLAGCGVASSTGNICWKADSEYGYY